MKRILCLLLSVSFLFSAAVTAHNAEGALTLSATRNGDRIFVTLCAKNLNVTSAQLLIQFNHVLLQFSDSTNLTNQEDSEMDVRLRTGTGGTVLINCSSMQTMSGDLVRLCFSLKEAPTEGSVDFTLSIRTLYVSQSTIGAVTKQTTVPCIGTSVTFSGSDKPDAVYAPGDVNQDGNVSSDDARLALRASVRLERLDAISLLLADIDGDGSVSSSDARRILRASVKLETLYMPLSIDQNHLKGS